jgi:hypothetical protein
MDMSFPEPHEYEDDRSSRPLMSRRQMSITASNWMSNHVASPPQVPEITFSPEEGRYINGEDNERMCVRIPQRCLRIHLTRI